jgi:hypothetical protein
MPEISDAELRMFVRYQNFGTPDEVQKKIGDLEKDNGTQREEIRLFKEKLPKDNEVVLPKAKADLLPKYEKLGKPEEIEKQLTEGVQAKEDLTITKQKESALKFVRASGLSEDSVETLIAIPALKDAKFEVRKGKVRDRNGIEKDGDVGYITLAGDNQKAMTITDAREQVPALKGLATAGTQSTERKGTEFVQQGGGTGTEGGTVYDRIRQQKAAKPAEDTTKQTVKPIQERLGMTRG